MTNARATTSVLGRPGRWSAGEALAILRRGAEDAAEAESTRHRDIVDWLQRDQPFRPPSDADALYDSVRNGGGGEQVFLSGNPAIQHFGYGELAHFARDQARSQYLGLGCPWIPGLPGKGDTVLDLGCGSGVDVEIAAVYVKPDGISWGIDKRATLLPASDSDRAIRFSLSQAERATAIPDDWATLVIANGLPPILSPRTASRVLSQVTRVLQPGGLFRAIVLAADCRESGTDENLILARKSGKPLFREFKACFKRSGLEVCRHYVLPSPYQASFRAPGVEAILFETSRIISK